MKIEDIPCKQQQFLQGSPRLNLDEQHYMDEMFAGAVYRHEIPHLVMEVMVFQHISQQSEESETGKSLHATSMTSLTIYLTFTAV
jgi:hypothetical protein